MPSGQGSSFNFLQEGGSFFDVGAHVGYYSMLASELVGKSGHIYSFKPTPRTFETLKENAGKKKILLCLIVRYFMKKKQ